VYESCPSPLLFRGICYVLVLVSPGICNAFVATTLVLLAHLVYHRRRRRHNNNNNNNNNGDCNATTVLHTYTDSYIVDPGSIFWQSGVCGGHSGAVLALVSDHPHPALDKTTHAISH